MSLFTGLWSVSDSWVEVQGLSSTRPDGVSLMTQYNASVFWIEKKFNEVFWFLFFARPITLTFTPDFDLSLTWTVIRQ